MTLAYSFKKIPCRQDFPLLNTPVVIVDSSSENFGKKGIYCGYYKREINYPKSNRSCLVRLQSREEIFIHPGWLAINLSGIGFPLKIQIERVCSNSTHYYAMHRLTGDVYNVMGVTGKYEVKLFHYVTKQFVYRFMLEFDFLEVFSLRCRASMEKLFRG